MAMNNQIQQMEPAAKFLAATAMSQTVSFCTERKYLSSLGLSGEPGAFQLQNIEKRSSLGASWIKITQIGKPIENSAENCFSAIQKILHSCFLPKEVQLLFIVCGDGKENSMYIGLRKSDDAAYSDINVKQHIRYLNEFVKGVWPDCKLR